MRKSVEDKLNMLFERPANDAFLATDSCYQSREQFGQHNAFFTFKVNVGESLLDCTQQQVTLDIRQLNVPVPRSELDSLIPISKYA